MLTPEKVNAWRIVPRIAVGVFLILLVYAVFWFFDLENPNNAQSMFISALIASSSAFFGFYMNTGKKD